MVRRTGTVLLALLLGVAACGTINNFNPTDGGHGNDLAMSGQQDLSMTGPQDMAMTGLQDLSGPRDLSMTGPQDMAGSKCSGTGNTFTKVRTKVFAAGCVVGEGGCHNSLSKAGLMDLTLMNPNTDLDNVAASIAPSKLRVKPGDPEHSFLWQKLNNLQGPSEGAPMPKGLVKWMPLPADELDLVYCWIKEGAKNN